MSIVRGLTRVAVAGLVWLAVSSLPIRADEPPEQGTWPQWRGPTRDGHCVGPAWPGSIGAEKLIEQWRAKLDAGYGGPIVTADRVFTVETKSKSHEIVRAFDRETGKQLWEQSWEGAMRVPFFAARNGSWVRSTPAFDGESLYVAGMRDVLVCLDAANGEIRWRVDFVKRYDASLPAFGCVCSPLVDGDHIYMQAAGALVKLDKRTGESVWRAMEDGGGMQGSAFSSPVIATLNGHKQVVVQSRTDLAGVDPDTGKTVWSKPIKAFRGMNILTPCIHEDRVFTSAHSGRSQLYAVEQQGDAAAARLVWDNKLQAYMSTPVIIDGHAYMHLRNQRFACIALAKGEIKWVTSEKFGKYWSLVAHGKQILALDEDGSLRLIRANPEKYDLIEARTLSEGDSWAHLAVAGDQLFVRELGAIVAYRWTR